MAEASKNKKVLKFEVSARYDEKTGKVSIFATDHDFAGLPFKVNILNPSNTHDSVISVMKDYGMNVEQSLVHTEDEEEIEIPLKYTYPAPTADLKGLILLGETSDDEQVHLDFDKHIFVEGGRGSGKINFLNLIIKGLQNHPAAVYHRFHYIDDLESLRKVSNYLLTLNVQGNPKSERVIIVSDGFKDMSEDTAGLIELELALLADSVRSTNNALFLFSVQKRLYERIVENSSIRSKVVSMIGNGMGVAEGLVVNGAYDPDEVKFSSYTLKENYIAALKHSNDN